MKNTSSYARLQDAIELLEDEQAFKRELLKEQVNITYESLKPLNLIRNAFKDISSLPNLSENTLGSAVGLASGYLSKKIFIGASGNIIRKLIGLILQFGITNVVSQHPEAIRSFGQYILEHFFRREGVNSKNRAR